MELNKSQKVILGVFTLIPFFIFPFIFFKIFHFVINVIATSSHGEPEVGDILAGVFSFIVPIILLGLLSLALFIFYIIHSIGNKVIEPIERLMWVLLFIFFGVVAFPIYWLMRIWNNQNNA